MATFAKDTAAVLGILAALILGVLFVVVEPKSRQLDNIRSQITTQELSLADESQKAHVVPELLRQIQAMKTKYKDFDRRLPKRKELGGFLKEISENLAEAKLANQTIEPGSPTQGEFYHTLPIILKFKGSYLALAGFFQHIDQMERLTRLQKMTINLDPQGGQDELDITVHMNIYFTES